MCSECEVQVPPLAMFPVGKAVCKKPVAARSKASPSAFSLLSYTTKYEPGFHSCSLQSLRQASRMPGHKEPADGGEPLRCVVVGGGIAGVCCAEELCRLRPEYDVMLVAEDHTLKVSRAASQLQSRGGCLSKCLGCQERAHCQALLLTRLSDAQQRLPDCSSAAPQGVANVVRLTRNVEEFDGALPCEGTGRQEQATTSATLPL